MTSVRNRSSRVRCKPESLIAVKTVLHEYRTHRPWPSCNANNLYFISVYGRTCMHDKTVGDESNIITNKTFAVQYEERFFDKRFTTPNFDYHRSLYFLTTGWVTTAFSSSLTYTFKPTPHFDV